jgi:predicted dehydrogenase/threonine dehydrogenase-like Zn-dependent dehydrogenase
MKQILQSLKTGVTEVADVPAPAARKRQVLVRTTRSLVSVGTERMLVEFGKANYLAKARQQPDKVKMVLDKVGTDGLVPTLEAVFNKLDQPLPLGYCNVGVVLEVGDDVTRVAVGERVVSNGHHAQVVSVPTNLCAVVPEAVTDEEAAFTIIGAIALQGIRLVAPSLGECVVVTGLGLIGLVTVQLLRAHGCRVLGIDFDAEKLALARQFGADVLNLSAGEDPISAANTFSRGRGVDAVLITASTTSNGPVHQAALMSRKRGRIVLVGVAGLELSRADFFEKELSFQVSCSYGPGRYDAEYEQQGFDYPVGFVRWTEQRNFEAVLDMMSDRRLDVRPLISHRFPIADAVEAYALVGGSAPSLGILLEYPTRGDQSDESVRASTVPLRAVAPASASPGRDAPTVTFVGAGNYATAVLIPAFKSAGGRLRTVVSQGGVSGVHAGRKFGFERATTDTDAVFSDDGADAIVVTTRHDTHALLACQALDAGKHVFVEKPLALTEVELDAVERARGRALERDAAPILMVGFNRRFAPQVQKMKALMDGVVEPKVLLMTVNAGTIPATHWTQDPAVGGGRIIGEACHFIDLMRHLVGSPITGFDASAMGRAPGVTIRDDRSAITLRFADGSIGTLLYTANGHKSYPKERLEVFAAGAVLQLNNFRTLEGFGWPGFSKLNLWRQDKGQRACASAFVDAVQRGSSGPIPFDEIMEVSRVTIRIGDALR